MVKNIILHINENFFSLLKIDKAKLEKYKGSMTWEEYIRQMFMLKNHLKEEIKKNGN